MIGEVSDGWGFGAIVHMPVSPCTPAFQYRDVPAMWLQSGAPPQEKVGGLRDPPRIRRGSGERRPASRGYVG